MAINAKTKILFAIEKVAKDIKYEERETNDAYEIIDYLGKLKTTVQVGHSIGAKRIDAFNVKSYENGMNEISFSRYLYNGDTKNQEEYVIMLLNKKTPIIEMVSSNKQIFVDGLESEHFPINIQCEQAYFLYKDKPTAMVETYIDNTNNKIIAQNFIRYYSLTRPRLFLSCGCGDRPLFIKYEDEIPVYFQIIDPNSKVETVGYNPNNPDDARKAVGLINAEFDALADNITNDFDKASAKQKIKK